MLDVLPDAAVDCILDALASRQDKAHLRLCCRSLAQTVDSTVRSSTVSLDGDALLHLPAYLTRLPSLYGLSLSAPYPGWQDECDFLEWLRRTHQAAPAVMGRVTSVSLLGVHATLGTGLALSLCCPSLTALQLGCPGAHCTLNSCFFRAFQGRPLRKLVLTPIGSHLSDNIVRELWGVTSLRHLEARIYAHDLHLLTRLVRLDHLTLALPGNNTCTIVVAAPLLAMTRLTHLDIPVREWRTAPGGERAQSLPLLAGMTCLQTLLLGRDFAVDDLTAVWLTRLTRLTQLSIASFCTTVPFPIPSLRSLQLATCHPQAISRSLHCLGAPLALHLTQTGAATDDEMDFTHEHGATAAAFKGALLGAAGAVAACRVHPHAFTLSSQLLSMADMVEVLTPLAPNSLTVTCPPHFGRQHFGFESDLQHHLDLGRLVGLHGLRRLALSYYALTTSDVAAIAGLAAVTLLQLHRCTVPAGADWGAPLVARPLSMHIAVKDPYA